MRFRPFQTGQSTEPKKQPDKVRFKIDFSKPYRIVKLKKYFEKSVSTTKPAFEKVSFKEQKPETESALKKSETEIENSEKLEKFSFASSCSIAAEFKDKPQLTEKTQFTET